MGQVNHAELGVPGNDYEIVQGNWDILGVCGPIGLVTGTELGETGNELGGKPGSCWRTLGISVWE